MPDANGMPDSGALRKWLDRLKDRDPRLHEELQARLSASVQEESVRFEGTAGGETAASDVVFETIVRSGRPALLVKDNRIATKDDETDQTAKELIRRLSDAKGVVEPVIPLVGRIDLANHAGGLTFAGTGWLIDKDIVVTNRHVAEIISRWEGGKYVFRPGRFGDPLGVSIDYLHELGVTATASVPVQSVIYIESDPRKADFALLRVARRTDGTFRDRIDVADADAPADTDIVVVGYPARAPSYLIPDQAWMDRLYGGTYDIKRVAPGLMGGASRGWATHDATTLGGNSGSVVLDMKTGRAVGLHFAGLYMIENYCVPASTLRKYLRDRPWHLGGHGEGTDAPRPDSTPAQQAPTATPNAGDGGEVTITIPLTIKVSLGKASSGTTIDVTTSTGKPPKKEPPSTAAVEAAQALQRELRGDGVLAVRHGYLIDGKGLSDTACVVVAADPACIDEIRARALKSFRGFPVDVREAGLLDQAGESVELAQEAAFEIAYDDENRTGKGFSFDWVEEEMDALLHVGPERSWTVLKEFLGGAKKELVSSIYEFHAAHIADALEEELGEGTDFTLVMAPQTRDPQSGTVAPGDFERAPRFEQWASDFGQQFERVFVPVGNGGLVARAYHIKVTVRDGNAFWLSSGNWKRASQPNIAAEDLDDPRVTGKAGNREWHAVLDNKTLAQRFRNHIRADYERCLELGGTPEALEEQVMVDVPLAAPESIALEAAPTQVFEPLQLSRRIRVKPLLTPDGKGAVYSNAVLELIRSAKKQLLFQNQYITVSPSSGGFFGELVDALVERSNEIDDVRVILRSGGSSFWDDLAELKRRGMDVNRCVRRISATHTKGIVVDGKRVLLGSHNWSSQGVTLNRDASLIFDDKEIAQYFARVFEEDWARSAELEAESAFAGGARLAVGAEPPPGFVRMPLSQYLEG